MATTKTVMLLNYQMGSSIKDVSTEGEGVVSMRTGEGVIDEADEMPSSQ